MIFREKKPIVPGYYWIKRPDFDPYPGHVSAMFPIDRSYLYGDRIEIPVPEVPYEHLNAGDIVEVKIKEDWVEQIVGTSGVEELCAITTSGLVLSPEDEDVWWRRTGLKLSRTGSRIIRG